MFRRLLSTWIIISFLSTSIVPLQRANADESLGLPNPGTIVNLTSAYEPALLKGLTVHKDNPFLFDFIMDTGHSQLKGDALKKEGDRLVKYFFACLTIPEKDLWVNLSPYEKDRMVPQALGQTAMGKDLLAEDYILKQLTASLIYPEKNLGKEFWNRVYAKARQLYGNTQIPVNTFNKVWILADKATVYEHGQTAFVLEKHLKVMLEEDYLATQKHAPFSASIIPANASIHNVGSQIIREIILPELEREVNQGQNFAPLRQIFNSLILASWYKKNLKQALLNQVYANRSTVNGINGQDPAIKEKIYQQYLQAYKKGVFNYIKEEPGTNGETVSRKYFSGGFGVKQGYEQEIDHLNQSQVSEVLPDGDFAQLTVLTSIANAVKRIRNSFRPGDVAKFKPRNRAEIQEDIKSLQVASHVIVQGARGRKIDSHELEALLRIQRAIGQLSFKEIQADNAMKTTLKSVVDSVTLGESVFNHPLEIEVIRDLHAGLVDRLERHMDTRQIPNWNKELQKYPSIVASFNREYDNPQDGSPSLRLSQTPSRIDGSPTSFTFNIREGDVTLLLSKLKDNLDQMDPKSVSKKQFLARLKEMVDAMKEDWTANFYLVDNHGFKNAFFDYLDQHFDQDSPFEHRSHGMARGGRGGFISLSGINKENLMKMMEYFYEHNPPVFYWLAQVFFPNSPWWEFEQYRQQFDAAMAGGDSFFDKRESRDAPPYVGSPRLGGGAGVDAKLNSFWRGGIINWGDLKAVDSLLRMLSFSRTRPAYEWNSREAETSFAVGADINFKRSEALLNIRLEHRQDPLALSPGLSVALLKASTGEVLSTAALEERELGDGVWFQARFEQIPLNEEDENEQFHLAFFDKTSGTEMFLGNKALGDAAMSDRHYLDTHLEPDSPSVRHAGVIGATPQAIIIPNNKVDLSDLRSIDALLRAVVLRHGGSVLMREARFLLTSLMNVKGEDEDEGEEVEAPKGARVVLNLSFRNGIVPGVLSSGGIALISDSNEKIAVMTKLKPTHETADGVVRFENQELQLEKGKNYHFAVLDAKGDMMYPDNKPMDFAMTMANRMNAILSERDFYGNGKQIVVVANSGKRLEEKTQINIPVGPIPPTRSVLSVIWSIDSGGDWMLDHRTQLMLLERMVGADNVLSELLKYFESANDRYKRSWAGKLLEIVKKDQKNLKERKPKAEMIRQAINFMNLILWNDQRVSLAVQNREDSVAVISNNEEIIIVLDDFSWDRKKSLIENVLGYLPTHTDDLIRNRLESHREYDLLSDLEGRKVKQNKLTANVEEFLKGKAYITAFGKGRDAVKVRFKSASQFYILDQSANRPKGKLYEVGIVPGKIYSPEDILNFVKIIPELRSGMNQEFAEIIRNVDRAAVARVVSPDEVGGIDLNDANMAMSVAKDANGGVKISFDPAMVARIRKDGVSSVVPVIINVTHMTSVLPLLGLAPGT